MDDTETALVPAAYDGREQALVKHRLLEDYLEKLFLIIGMGTKAGGSKELCYVDCFAGPWGDPSEDMQATSIAISLRTLDTCRQKLASLKVFVKIKALYIEKKQSSFKRLQAHLAAARQGLRQPGNGVGRPVREVIHARHLRRRRPPARRPSRRRRR